MAEKNLELAVRKVTLGENKVCGLTHSDDAAKAYQAGAVFGGLIFVDASKRHMDVEAARLTMSGAPLNYVGVFQNHSVADVAHTVSELGLFAVQLHGDESQTYVNELKQSLPESVEVWKAYGVASGATSGEKSALPELLESNVTRHLLDTKAGSQTGGTGQAFDWSLIKNKSAIMLAGGLNPENANQAAKLGCLGLDLNSGVESAPGKKCADKLQRAFAAIRNY